MEKLTPKAAESLAWVDALRGIAILGVMLVHCCFIFSSQPPIQWILSGQFGVQLFFVASAFTLARSWHRRKAEQHPIKNYLVRRFLRIAPLYAVGVLTYALLAKMNMGVFPANHYTLKSIGANLLFVHGWLPFAQNGVMPGGWSIGVEMSFYLLVPFLATRLFRPQTAAMAFMASIPLAGIFAWGAYQFSKSELLPTHSGGLNWPVDNNTFLYFWLPTQLPVFTLGFLAYGLFNHHRLRQWAAKHNHQVSMLFLGLSLIGFGILSLSMGKVTPAPFWLPLILQPHFFLLAPALAGIACCALLLSLALHPWRLFVNPVTVFFGKISYSLYIVHFIGAWMLAPWIREYLSWPQNQPLGALATFAASVLSCLAFSIPIAMLTHRFIEKPGIAFGKHLIERLEKNAVAKPT